MNKINKHRHDGYYFKTGQKSNELKKEKTTDFIKAHT